MKDIIRLIRPQQWTKNVFVLLPLFFGGALLERQAMVGGLLAFLAFCFIASSIYCFNDLIDVEADRRHPVKRLRPIASGAVNMKTAYALMALMLVFSMAVLGVLYLIQMPSSAVAIKVGGVLLFYWLMNICYCKWLKRYAIVDVCTVAFGFVLRILAGGMAAGVMLSKWIVLMTFLLTLFLSLAKRRDDVLRMEATGEAPRQNTSRYNREFINQAITITASVTLVCYIMYTVSPEVVERFHTDYLYLTTVFVLLGLLRYLQIAVVDKRSGDPTKVMLKDIFMQLIVLAWGLSFLLIIYLL